MCLLGIVERPGVSWGVLGCPGVIRLTRHRHFIFCRIVHNMEQKLSRAFISINKNKGL